MLILSLWAVNSAASSSFNDTGISFDDEILDAVGTLGDFVTDDIEVPGGTLKNVTFGYINFSTSSLGIWGLGYGPGGLASQSNLIDAMMNQKIITSRAYSLYLNDPRKFTLLFLRVPISISSKDVLFTSNETFSLDQNIV